MLQKLIDVNFKTTDSGTWFFKWGPIFRGQQVTPDQEIRLRKALRTIYLWTWLPLFAVGILVGPGLTLWFLPAVCLHYQLAFGRILVGKERPDRITLREHFARIAQLLPRWSLTVGSVISALFVLGGCAFYIEEVITLRIAEANNLVYDDSLGSCILCIILFSCSYTLFSAAVLEQSEALAGRAPSKTSHEVMSG